LLEECSNWTLVWILLTEAPILYPTLGVLWRLVDIIFHNLFVILEELLYKISDIGII